MENNNASLWEERHLKHMFKSHPCNPPRCSAWSHWNCKWNPGNLSEVRVWQHRIGPVVFTNKSSWIILAKGPTRCHLHRKNLHKHLQLQHSGLGNPDCPFQWCTPKSTDCALKPRVASKSRADSWHRQMEAGGGRITQQEAQHPSPGSAAPARLCSGQHKVSWTQIQEQCSGY